MAVTCGSGVSVGHSKGALGKVRSHLDVCRDGNCRNIWQSFVNPCQARGAETEVRHATKCG